ncbi:MAG TPA: alpha/beta hydrolase [Terracidiphilus sp.]|nr:alpha/beta hydrolase [Terracidiphilus sp.]
MRGIRHKPSKGWKQTVVAAIIPVLPLSSFPGRLIQAFLLERGASETLTRNVRAAIRRVKPGVLRHRLKFVLACDEREALRQICVPILYLRPSDDRLVPRAALDEILRFKPETEVVEVAGPHLLLQVNPKAAAEAVAQFLVQVGGEGAGAMR